MAESGEKEEPEVGHRETSPPGRETREDWKGSQRQKEPPPNSGNDNNNKAAGNRSRSRSPINRGRRSSSPGRGRQYSKDGTNTTSDEPHLQRARLFVGNIEPNRTHRRDLVRLFSRHGDVLGVSVHKGYAFVQMDRERSANKAINYEDNRVFMGSRIHVEFSQAALKNGAKFIRIPIEESPPRDVRPTPVASQVATQSLALLEIEREREERLSRILQMERELSYLRQKENGTRPHADPSYNRYDSYRRGNSPGPHPSRDANYIPQKEPAYESSRVDDRGRGYYNRPVPDPMPRGPAGGDSYRQNVSYPIQGGTNRYDRRDEPPSQYGTGGGYNRAGPMPAPNVGYGGSGGGNPAGKSSGPGGVPPGWPSSGYDKSNANRPPFASATPWN